MVEEIRAQFIKVFRRDPVIIIAPGRINLIGEHTDYNEGFVMPAAIDKHIVFAIAANGTQTVNCVALDNNERASFELSGLNPGKSWVNYLMGVLQGMRQQGAALAGVDCMFSSTIPAGAGLSSSAALCCGFAFGVCEVLKVQMSRLTIAHVGQFAEHHFAGVMCGIMDQYASLFGEQDCALLLDCRTLKHENLPVDTSEFSLVLIDSKVKHSLASTAYNDRRASCEEAVLIVRTNHVGVKSLRDVSPLMLYELQDRLGDDTYMKAMYVVEEIARTQAAAQHLRENQLEKFGELMFETHWGLSRMYDVSCAELDHLVEWAQENPSVVCGSRMMGGGFGGCTINLVRSGQVNYLKGYVHEKYFATFGTEPDFYTFKLSQGVHRAGN
jgi:galactokinase